MPIQCDHCGQGSSVVVTARTNKGPLIVCKPCKARLSGATRKSGNVWRQTIWSTGAGCFPHQVAENRRYCSEQGFDVTFRDDDGAVGFTDRRELKRYLRHYDMTLKSGGV
jgi:hypothetical protein